MKPLVDEFVEKSSNCLNTLNEEGDNDDLIEDLNAHVDSIKLK